MDLSNGEWTTTIGLLIVVVAGQATVGLEILEQLSELAALAMENARLYQTVQDELAERKRTEEAFLRSEYPAAAVERDAEDLDTWVKALLAHLEGQQPDLSLPLDLQATAFQQRVWAELRKIPYGETRTYTQVAEAIGRPKAVRAVANACAANPAAVVTPCHRVVRRDGSLGGYRWGIERKKTLLKNERG